MPVSIGIPIRPCGITGFAPLPSADTSLVGTRGADGAPHVATDTYCTAPLSPVGVYTL
jgi:hypothetical protein